MSILANYPLWKHSTLRAGGAAERFAVARTVDELAALAEGGPITVVGGGSNILPSDHGVPGLVVLNRSAGIEIRDETVTVDTGVSLQEVFLKTAQAGLSGLQYAVGIPGSVGGALVSNAGAYRSNISEVVTGLEVVEDGVRHWAEPSVMGFSYRDSVLRSATPPRLVTLRARFQLERRSRQEIFEEARDFQRQRISKQPPQASAGSFFKNVTDVVLAQEIAGLSDGMRKAGVIPAGFLLEQVGMKGYRLGGAGFGRKHANFMLNLGGATATEIRSLAQLGARRVRERFGVELEAEVLYLGDWTGFVPVQE